MAVPNDANELVVLDAKCKKLALSEEMPTASSATLAGSERTAEPRTAEPHRLHTERVFQLSQPQFSQNKSTLCAVLAAT
jgi:hypothetical protein